MRMVLLIGVFCPYLMESEMIAKKRHVLVESSDASLAEQLEALQIHGATFDGDIIGKGTRDELNELGWADRDEHGDNVITEKGAYALAFYKKRGRMPQQMAQSVRVFVRDVV